MIILPNKETLERREMLFQSLKDLTQQYYLADDKVLVDMEKFTEAIHVILCLSILRIVSKLCSDDPELNEDDCRIKAKRIINLNFDLMFRPTFEEIKKLISETPDDE